MSRSRQVRSVFLALLMVVSVVAMGGVGFVGEADAKQYTGDQFVEVTDTGNLTVWERSVLPLRADTSQANTTIKNQATYIHSEGDQVNANRNELGVFEPGTIGLNYQDGANGARTSKFADESGQIIVASFEKNRRTSEVAASDDMGDLVDHALDGNMSQLQTEAEARNITFRIAKTAPSLFGGQGGFDYSLNVTNSGPHAIIAATGDNFSVTNGQLELDGTATIVGVEAIAVQQNASSMNLPDSAISGTDIEVDASTSLSGNVSHSVLVYDEAKFKNGRTNINVTEGTIGNLSSDDIIIEHSINETNGVNTITQDGQVFGNNVSARTLTGTTAYGDIIDQLNNRTGTNVQRKSIGTTVLDASRTVVPNASADETITVETYGNWTSGEYRVVHVAENGTVRGFETSTDTITIENDEFFEVNITDTNSPVTETESLDVEATIENTGGVEGTQTIELEIDGRVVGSTDVTLDGSQQQTVTLTWATEAGDAGEYTATVSSEDDSDTEAVRVDGDAVFDVTITDYDEPGIVGQTIEVDYEVENTYFDTATQNISFLVDGTELQGKRVVDQTLDAGQTHTGTFAYTVNSSDPPEINATVATAFDSDSATITAASQANLSIDNLSALPETAYRGQEITLNGTIANSGGLAASTDVNLTVNTSATNPIEETAIRVPGNSNKTVTFTYTPESTANLSFTFGIDGETKTKNVSVLDTETDFTVTRSALSPTSDVTSGDLITVNATIHNGGTGGGTQAVGLEWNSTSTTQPTAVDSTNVELKQGDDANVTLQHRLSVDREGEDVTFNVTTLDDYNEFTPISVQESANFTVGIENKAALDSFTAGDTIGVEYYVNNTGDLAGTQTIRVSLGGNTVATERLQRDPGDNDSESVDVTTDSSMVGQDQTLSVQSFDDSDSTSIDIDTPAEFEVSIDSVNKPVAGDTLKVDVSVENVGDEQGTQTITLDAGALGTNDTSVTVAGGTTTSETLTITTEDGDAGTYSLLVTSDNDSVLGQATVLEPAAYEVQIDSVSDPVRANQETLDVEATIKNTGDVSGTETVNFAVDGSKEDSQTVTIASGASQTVTFDSFTPQTSGDSTINVSAGDAAAERDVTVLDALDDPIFRVSNVQLTDGTVSDALLRESGPTVELSADVKNIGDFSGTQDVRFMVDGTTIDSQSVTLDSDATDTVTFDVDPTDIRVGDRTFAIASDDSSQRTTVAVRESRDAEFAVEIEDIDSLDRNDVVNATVSNLGDETVEQTIEFELRTDDRVVNSIEPDVELGYNESTTIELDFEDATLAGDYRGRFTVKSNDDTDRATATIDFGSIDEAIGVATPGDRVDVASGTYTATTTVDKKVKLRGGGAIINVSDTETAMTVTRNAAEVHGFVFERAENGIQVTGDDVDIRFNRFNTGVKNGTVVTGDDVRIRNNRFDYNERAIVLKDGAQGASIRNNNIFDASQRAIYSTGGVHVMHNNNIERSAVAVEALGGQIDATNNWWGRPGGPRDDEILSPVTIEPWDTDPNEEPDYQIVETNLEDIGDVIEDDPSNVTYTIKNVGGTAGDTADELVLTLGGTELDRTPAFEIGADGELVVADEDDFDPLQTEITSAMARNIDSGTLKLATSDDSNLTTVNVKTAPKFEVDITSIPSELESDQTLSVDVQINNTGQAAGDVDAELQFDGVSTDTETVSVAGEGTATTTLTRSLSTNDIGSNIQVKVDVGDDTATTSVTVTEAETADQEDQTTEEPADQTTPTTGGGPAPPAPEVIEDPGTEIETPPDVTVTRAERSQISIDEETGRARVTFTEESATESITFEDTDVEGEVTVADLDREPDETGPSPGRSVSVTQITVPDPDRPATIRTRVSSERLADVDADAEDLRINRFNDDAGEWQALETEVVETTTERVVLEADTPGFSYFAVSAVSEPDAVIAAPATVQVGEDFTLDGSGSSDRYGEIVAYEWDIDGETLTGETVTTASDTAGDVTVELTVENDAGETDTATATITAQEAPVEGPEEEPEAEPTEEPAGFQFYGSIVFAILVILGALLYIYRREIKME